MTDFGSCGWDSEFFGFPIFRLTADGGVSAGSVMGKVREFLSGEESALCYISLDSEAHDACSAALAAAGAVHYGSRVVFAMPLTEKNISRDNGACPVPVLDGEVRDLAVSSGRCSRFFRDGCLEKKARQMYVAWIENGFSAREKGTGDVFGIWDEGSLAGLVSVSTADGKAKIELLAVAEEHRRKGIGRRLVHAAFAFACRKSCSEMTVATQGENTQACSLYAAWGMAERERREIWHLKR